MMGIMLNVQKVLMLKMFDECIHEIPAGIAVRNLYLIYHLVGAHSNFELIESTLLLFFTCRTAVAISAKFYLFYEFFLNILSTLISLFAKFLSCILVILLFFNTSAAFLVMKVSYVPSGVKKSLPSHLSINTPL